MSRDKSPSRLRFAQSLRSVQKTSRMLKVSVEESKAQRIKRQQARFRDRGGAFVPSDKNPLLDILLSRAVSGASPPKASLPLRSNVSPRLHDHPVDKTLTSPRRGTHAGLLQSGDNKIDVSFSEGSKAVAGRSKVAERVVGVVPKKAVSKKNKSATSRDKLTRGAGKPKSSSLAKPTLVNSGTVPLKHTGPTNVVHATEINTNVSDDETLVETLPKAVGKSKKRKQVASEGNVGMKKKRTTTNIAHAETVRSEKAGTKSSGSGEVHKGTSLLDDPKDLGHELQVKRRVAFKDNKKKGKRPKITSDIQDPPIVDGDVSECLQGKVAARFDGDEKRTVQKQGKKKTVIFEFSEFHNDESAPRKRKRGTTLNLVEENHDDRLSKAVHECSMAPGVSSERLKENTVLAHIKNPKHDLISRKASGGPPREVIDRINAIAANHRPIDNEPDPLDCLS